MGVMQCVLCTAGFVIPLWPCVESKCKIRIECDESSITHCNSLVSKQALGKPTSRLLFSQSIQPSCHFLPHLRCLTVKFFFSITAILPTTVSGTSLHKKWLQNKHVLHLAAILRH